MVRTPSLPLDVDLCGALGELVRVLADHEWATFFFLVTLRRRPGCSVKDAPSSSRAVGANAQLVVGVHVDLGGGQRVGHGLASGLDHALVTGSVDGHHLQGGDVQTESLAADRWCSGWWRGPRPALSMPRESAPAPTLVAVVQ